jgi:hypothetical protein
MSRPAPRLLTTILISSRPIPWPLIAVQIVKAFCCECSPRATSLARRPKGISAIAAKRRLKTPSLLYQDKMVHVLGNVQGRGPSMSFKLRAGKSCSSNSWSTRMPEWTPLQNEIVSSIPRTQVDKKIIGADLHVQVWMLSQEGSSRGTRHFVAEEKPGLILSIETAIGILIRSTTSATLPRAWATVTCRVSSASG